MYSKFQKKLITIVMTFAIVLSLLPALSIPAKAFSGSGSGTLGDPYLVSTAAQLNDVRNDLSAYYKQTADINVSGYANWARIGNSTTAGDNFTGTYDGSGYRIMGLSITSTTASGNGLFGVIGSGGTVKNLGVSGSVTGSNAQLGLLVGYNSGGTVQNCSSAGSVTTTSNNAGGLVGTTSGSVTQCYSTATVTATGSSSSNIGGLIGSSTAAGNISQSYSAGSVTNETTGTGNTGGLIGLISGTLTNCYSSGSVSTPNGGYTGGLIGGAGTAPTVSNCYTYDSVTGSATTTKIGGLVGYWYTGGTFTNCDFDSDATGTTTACGYAYNVTVIGIDAKTTAEMKTAATFSGWNASIWHIPGGSYPKLLWQFPTVSSISVSSGSDTGGTSVTITGTGFNSSPTVMFGSSSAASVTYNSLTSLTVVSPAGTGTVDITVTVGSGTSAASAADQFTYTAADTTAPAVSDKTITSSGISQTGATLSWDKATDNTSAQTALQYLVYQSSSDNLASVANIEANGTALGSYAADIATKTVGSLTAGTTYYFNVIVKDAVGNKTCYTAKSVTTSAAATAPTVTTQAVSSIASTTATGNGNITSLGTPNPTAYGVCWNTTGTPTTSDIKVDKGAASATGAFTASMTGLTANTTYYVRAYATNTAGTSYGTEVSFTTIGSAPTVTTQAVSSIASTTATGNGNITSLGTPNPTAHGVCWNTTGTPTTSDSKVDKGAASATGAFTASMTGLTANTTYYVRAYATNTAGTSYGTEVSFTTIGIAPTVTTQAVSSIASTTATGNGNITSLGTPNPTAYGVCWNTTGTPTTSDIKVDKGAASATGAFTVSMTGLTANTTYYVRAYATNTAGTSYGTEVSFATIGIAPTVTTQAVSSIASTTATGNGNITSLGTPNPTAYGVCWNTTGTPTTSDIKVDKGAASATGAFTVSMTGLTANTTYYVRAYATNTAGTSYGTEVSFTTAAADTTPPDSPTYSPANSATGVAVTIKPTLTFGEALCSNASAAAMGAAPTGVIKVYMGTNSAGTALTEGAGADFTVAYNSGTHVFTVTFGASLKTSQAYYIELQANKVYDAAGNPIAAAQGATFSTVAATATVNTKVDGIFTDMTSVALKNGSTTVTAAKSATGVYTVSVTNGTYEVWVNGVYTGSNIVINSASASADINYYTVTFNSQGGSAVDSQTILSGGKAAIPTPPTKPGSNFAGWYTETGCTTPWNFSTGIPAARPLFAKWIPVATFKVTYAAGGGTTGTVPVDSTDYAFNATVTVKGNTGSLAKSGNSFSGWSYGGTTYTAGQTFVIKNNVSLTAVWTPVPSVYTVTYSNNYTGGGTCATQNSIHSGATLSAPGDPVRGGFTFVGWYKDSACVTRWNFGADTVTSDITLYAKWTENTYSVNGTVKDDGAVVVNGATVKVIQGNVLFGETVTAADGTFVVAGVPNGVYNLVTSKGSQEVTVCITVIGVNYAAGTVTLPSGNKNSTLEVNGSGTPNIVVDNLNGVFGDPNVYTPADDNDVSHNGATVEIKLTVQQNDSSTNKSTVLATMTSGGYTAGMVLDVDMTKTVTSSSGALTSETSVTTVDSFITLIIPLPAEMQGKASYVVTRAHDYNDGRGIVVDTITTSNDPTKERIVVSADKTQLTLYVKFFSTYAIGYTVTSGGTGGGDTAGTGYTITATAGTGGSISPSSASVVSGGSKTFTVTANEGYAISDVLVDGKSVGAVGSYTFSNVSASHSIAVSFISIGLPYYTDGSGNTVFIGFSANASGTMKYIAPSGATVSFKENHKSFADTSGHWANPSITFVTEREIFVGTGVNQFSPNTSMTRAMFVTVIGRLYERSYGPLKIGGGYAFTDCNYSLWYGTYVDWCAENGIITGVGGGLFAPDRGITREEMATMLYRFAKFLNTSTAVSNGTQLAYPDAAQIGSWALDAAKYCQQTGIITGRDGGAFAPQGTAMRAEVAVILERFIVNMLKDK